MPVMLPCLTAPPLVLHSSTLMQHLSVECYSYAVVDSIMNETAGDVQATPVPSIQTWRPLRWDLRRSSSSPGARHRLGT